MELTLFLSRELPESVDVNVALSACGPECNTDNSLLEPNPISYTRLYETYFRAHLLILGYASKSTSNLFLRSL